MSTPELPQPKTAPPSKLRIQVFIISMLVALALSSVGAVTTAAIVAIRLGTLPTNLVGITTGSFIVFFALTATAALIVSQLITAPISHRLRRLRRVIKAMADGDLSQRTGLLPDDEIGALGRGLDIATSRQSATIHQLKTNMRTGEEAVAQLGALVENLPDGVIMLDRRARIMVMNRAALGMFSTEELFWESDFAEFINYLDAGRPLSAQLTSRACRQAKVRNRVLEAEAAVVTDSAGEELGIVLVIRDVTRTTESAHLKDRFVAQYAHELKTPLIEIEHTSEMLAQVTPTNPFAKIVHRNARLTNAMVGETLDIVAMLEGNFTIQPEVMTLAPLLLETLHTYTPRFHATKIELQTLILAPHLRVRGDAPRLRMALDHLLDNALSYTAEGGTVTVSMGAPIMGYAVIDVADTGAGITPADLPHIFEAYYRGASVIFNGKGPAPDGLGLGLFVAHTIAQAHDGSLTVTSEPGKGSTFSLVLPLTNG